MKLTAEQTKRIVANIERYLEKEVSVSERMSANNSELAAFVSSSVAKDVRTKSFFAEDMPLEEYLPALSSSSDALINALDENLTLAKSKLCVDNSAYVADFCGKITERLKVDARLKPSPALFSENVAKIRGGKVAFADSQLLALAFSKFQKKDAELTPSHVRSFTDACEDVESGICDYCILPIENNREGILLTVYNLIDRYDLYVAKVCSVENSDLTTKFALLYPRIHGIIETFGKQFVDLRFSTHSQKLFAEILTGASVLDISLIKTVATPLGYADGYTHICTFSGNNESLFSFLLFLKTIRADYTLIGAYEETL